MINIYISTFFPNETFGGDYKTTKVHQAYVKGEEAFLAEIKSAVVKVFDPKDKTYKSIKILNMPEEIMQLAYYVFNYVILNNPNAVLAQCNHTFVFHLYGDCYAHVTFSSDDVLKEKPFNLYDY